MVGHSQQNARRQASINPSILTPKAAPMGGPTSVAIGYFQPKGYINGRRKTSEEYGLSQDVCEDEIG